MENKDVRRPLLIALATLAFIGGGTSLVLACGGGWDGGGAANHQYKPGCGPDKTDGVAGNSGRHQGQPPKDQNRGDCPNPPGQQTGGDKKDDDKKGSSSSSSKGSSSSSGNSKKR
jgi:hypothetical protein